MTTFFSPAKLNLFFRVLKKRPDGFHEIASLYQTISLGDILTISFQKEKDTLECLHPFVPLDQSNLILQAASLFRKKTKIEKYFHFHLEKKIPLEAGLGGGSSNAATTLWGLNQLLEKKIDSSTLATWGSELGSDVPFFFSEGRAYCYGRGELFISQPSKHMKLWIAKPKKGLCTARVYSHIQPEALKNRNPLDALSSHQTDHPLFFNDLEIPAFQLLPELRTIRAKLLSLGFEQVHMTGSGTAFFCLGNRNNPLIANIDFYPTKFIHRMRENWYKFPY